MLKTKCGRKSNARVAQGDTITTQVLTDIMDVIARDPRGSHEYNQQGLVEETEHSAGRVKATFTKLTPHFRKHYGTDWWPIMADTGPASSLRAQACITR